MDNRANSQTIGLIALMTIVTGVVAFYSLRSTSQKQLPPLQLKDPPAAAMQAAPAPESGAALTSTSQDGAPAREIVVDVAGAVNRPDVYHLPAGSRVDDAIKAAGGPIQGADTSALNLAALVQDGAKIYVPLAGEAQRAVENGATARSQPRQPVQPATEPDPAGESSGAGGNASGKLSDPSQGTVNINTAGIDELQRLPGVGPAIAQRILDFRQASGPFRSPEDLRNVSGIGEKKYAKLAAFVVVN